MSINSRRLIANVATFAIAIRIMLFWAGWKMDMAAVLSATVLPS